MSEVFSKDSIKFFIKACSFAIAQEYKKDLQDINVLEIAGYLKNVLEGQKRLGRDAELMQSEGEILAHIEPFYHSLRFILADYIDKGLGDEATKELKKSVLHTVRILDQMFGKFPKITQHSVWGF